MKYQAIGTICGTVTRRRRGDGWVIKSTDGCYFPLAYIRPGLFANLNDMPQEDIRLRVYPRQERLEDGKFWVLFSLIGIDNKGGTPDEFVLSGDVVQVNPEKKFLRLRIGRNRKPPKDEEEKMHWKTFTFQIQCPNGCPSNLGKQSRIRVKRDGYVFVFIEVLENESNSEKAHRRRTGTLRTGRSSDPTRQAGGMAQKVCQV